MDNNERTNNDYYPENENRPRSNNVLLILLILLLLGSIGFNVYQYYSREKQEKILSEEVVNSNDLRKQLQSELDSTLAQMDEYKGRVAKLDTVIQQREDELIEKAKRIEQLLKSNKINYNKYISIKDEIDKWKYYADKYKKEVDRLSDENKKLTAQNETLQQEVKEKRHAIDTLTDNYVSMSNRIALAERLVAQDIQITGVKVKNSGKERETDRASQLDKLKFCFTVPENKVAKAGSRDIFVQLIDPHGQTVSVDALGSGVTSLEGQQVQYTTHQTVDYNQETKNYCIYWGKDTPFEPGKYNVVLITNGYKLGEKSYTIK